jgi:ornithine cyclodeaminase/alanine dehydrogenase
LAYDQNEEHALRLAREVTQDLTIVARAVTDLAAAVRQSDICVTCTTSRQPFLCSDDVAPGTFLAAVGADDPEKQELHTDLMAKNKVVTDLIEQCAVMGDLHHALEAGVLTRSDVYAELGDVVAGKKLGRESDEEIIIFDSTGMALQDVSAAAFVYEKAERQGSGVRFSFAA